METFYDKAKELVSRFLNLHSNIDDVGCAKTCAIESIDLIIEVIKEDFGDRKNQNIIDWYETLKEEIEKLPC